MENITQRFSISVQRPRVVTGSQVMSAMLEHDCLLHQSQLQVKTDLTIIPCVLEWFGQFETFLPQEVWMQSKLLMVEGLTNAVRHAHEQLPVQTPIDLQVNIFAEAIEIYIWDVGPPFNLEALLAGVETQYPDPLAHEAHWGGSLMKKLRDQHGWQIHYYECCDSVHEVRSFSAMPEESCEEPRSLADYERNCLTICRQFKRS